jgi:hypothetical protein
VHRVWRYLYFEKRNYPSEKDNVVFPFPCPSSICMSILVLNGLPLRMWCTMVCVLSGMSIM